MNRRRIGPLRIAARHVAHLAHNRGSAADDSAWREIPCERLARARDALDVMLAAGMLESVLVVLKRSDL